MQDRPTRQPGPPGSCPICGAPRDAHYKPFCSRRCADVDLGRWLSGSYAISTSSDDADEDGDDAKARAASGKPAERPHEDE